MSSPTTSTWSTEPLFTVVVALGSNLGDRRYNLRRAVDRISRIMSVVRVSSFVPTIPVGAPAGSPDFYNAVVAGFTTVRPVPFVRELLAIERSLGRVRRGIRNAPRVIDLDLIVHSGHRLATRELTLPHPRAFQRAFVMDPVRELGLTGFRLAPPPRRGPAARAGFV